MHSDRTVAATYLGIDLGGGEIKAVALSTDSQVVSRQRVTTAAAQGRDAVLARIASLVSSLSAQLRAQGPRGTASVRAVGVAAPGVLNMDTGACELLPAFTPEWTGFPLKQQLEERLRLPVFVINDVRAATLAEHVCGAGRPYRDFACIAVGTGIGGGLVLDDQLYFGSRGGAGELGHQTVVPDGPVCGCGNRGCLEAMASGPAITRRAREAADDVHLRRLVGTDEPTPKQVAEAAVAGNRTARDIYAQVGQLIGLALGNVIVTLNPQAVVVGGGVSLAGEVLLNPIRREVERRTVVFTWERGGVDIVRSPLEGEAGAIGAATWARLSDA